MARVAADSSVFHAIADPTRRAILDLLRDGEQTVTTLMDRVSPPTSPAAGKPSRRPRTAGRTPRRRGAAASVTPRISQSAFSQHLAVLRGAGLVDSHKSGRTRVYALRPAPLRQVVDWIALYDAFWTEKLDQLGDYLDRGHSAPSPPRGGPMTNSGARP